jgi:hypothetical protein
MVGSEMLPMLYSELHPRGRHAEKSQLPLRRSLPSLEDQARPYTEQTADLLGINRTAIGNMEIRRVSKAYALALSAIDYRLKPWGPDNDPQ